MALDHALRFPVLTIGSGPANSLRGAAYLTGRDDGIVIDVGGTSTDIGVLVGGFPRESSQAVEIGGIRTNFRMPDIVSIAIGGGTIVRPGQVGPDSVAWRIHSEALAFGGATPTLTDAALLAGRAQDIGTLSARTPRMPPCWPPAWRLADAAVADAIDRVKTSRAAVPLIAVGGGSIILADRIAGVSEVLRPPNHDVANAIGAAIAHGQRQRGGGRLLPRPGPRGGRRGDRRARRSGGRGGRRGSRTGHRRGRRGDAAHLPHGARRAHPGQGGRAARHGLSGERPGRPRRVSFATHRPGAASSSGGRVRKAWRAAAVHPQPAPRRTQHRWIHGTGRAAAHAAWPPRSSPPACSWRPPSRPRPRMRR